MDKMGRRSMITNFKIFEEVNIPVKVGDTILRGKFKNVKVKVKKIGKDQKGQPTINDQKMLTFRMLTKKQQKELKENMNNLKSFKVYNESFDETSYSYPPFSKVVDKIKKGYNKLTKPGDSDDYLKLLFKEIRNDFDSNHLEGKIEGQNFCYEYTSIDGSTLKVTREYHGRSTPWNKRTGSYDNPEDSVYRIWIDDKTFIFGNGDVTREFNQYLIEDIYQFLKKKYDENK